MNGSEPTQTDHNSSKCVNSKLNQNLNKIDSQLWLFRAISNRADAYEGTE